MRKCINEIHKNQLYNHSKTKHNQITRISHRGHFVFAQNDSWSYGIYSMLHICPIHARYNAVLYSINRPCLILLHVFIKTHKIWWRGLNEKTNRWTGVGYIHNTKLKTIIKGTMLNSITNMSERAYVKMQGTTAIHLFFKPRSKKTANDTPGSLLDKVVWLWRRH